MFLNEGCSEDCPFGPRGHLSYLRLLPQPQQSLIKTQQSVVPAALRQAFLQSDRAQASAMLRHIADQLRQKWPRLAAFIA